MWNLSTTPDDRLGEPTAALRADWRCLAAITALGLACRLALLPRSSVWIDEAFSIWMASQPLDQMLASLKLDVGVPAYYVLLRGWIAVFGDGEIACAALSLLWSAALPPLYYLLAAQLTADRRTSRVAALLGAIGAASLFHATNIRWYSMLEVTSILVVYGMFRIVRQGRWGVFVAAGVLACYTHYFSVILVFAVSLMVLLAFRAHVRSAAPAVAFVGGTFALWLPMLVAQMSRNPSAQLVGYDHVGIAASELVRSLALNMGLPTRHHLYWLSLGVLAALASRRGPARRLSGMLLLGFGVTVGVPVLISMVKPVAYVGRYDLVGRPFALLLLAILVARLPSWMAWLPLAAVALSGALLLRTHVPNPFDGPRQTTARAAALLRPDDALLFLDLTELTNRYHLRQRGATHGPVFRFPEAFAGNPGNRFVHLFADRGPQLTAERAALLASLEASGAPRVVVFAAPGLGVVGEQNAALIRTLEQRHRRVAAVDAVATTWGPNCRRILIYALRPSPTE